MKKLILTLLMMMVASCATPDKPEPIERIKYVAAKNSYIIDLCSRENMPRYPNRPKLTSRDIKNLTEAQMDEKIKAHIEALESHIDKLEGIVLETRKRVDLCR